MILSSAKRMIGVVEAKNRHPLGNARDLVQKRKLMWVSTGLRGQTSTADKVLGVGQQNADNALAATISKAVTNARVREPLLLQLSQPFTVVPTSATVFISLFTTTYCQSHLKFLPVGQYKHLE